MITHVALAAMALAGYTTASSPTLQDPAGTHARGMVACPAGSVPLGGGVGIHPFGVGDHVESTFPSGNGWATDVSAGPSGIVFDVQVVCAQQPRGYTVV